MMQGLSSQTIIHIWETGLHQHPVERALTMLGAVLPESARSDLLKLSVGQRDTYLLLLHEQTFGSSFAGYAECPHCQQHLEFTFDSASIRVGAASIETIGQVQRYAIADYEIHARLPNHADLLAITHCRDVANARELLLLHCVVEAFHKGDIIATHSLPETVIEALGERMVEQDPQSDIRIDLSCPTCQHTWWVTFDIATFLWIEIRTHTKRLLREVDILARAYGWREDDILGMSEVRRQAYLEMVS